MLRLEYRWVRNTHLGVRTVEMGAGVMEKNEVLGLVCVEQGPVGPDMS